MALNLSRNSRLWVSTVESGHNNSNTFEIPLQDGYTLSQNPSFEDVSPEEAGPVPVRGSRRFNVSLDPVDWSFGSYLTPYLYDTDKIMTVDAILWHAISTTNALALDLDGDGANGPGNTDVYYTNTEFNVGFTKNGAHVLTKLYLYFKIDTKVYKVSNAQINQVEVPLDISGIAMANWSGQGTSIEEISAPAFMSGSGLAFDDAVPTSNEFVAVPSNKEYLLNKLTTVTMQSDVTGTSKYYHIALTGGSITINNNISYVTPNTLAELDVPVGSFTGSFEVTGTVDSYLKDGLGLKDGSSAANAYGSQDLLNHMLTNRDINHATDITFEINGKTSTARVEINLPNAMIGVPAMNVEQIVSQSFEFKGIPSSADMDDGDEVNLKFYVA